MPRSRQDSPDDSDEAGPSRRLKRPKMSRSSRAGLIFPVGRINRFLRKGDYAERIGSGASVYMAAVLQYLITDIVDIAGATASHDKKRRIAPKHLLWTINNDQELNFLLGHVNVPQVKTCRKPRKTPTAASSRKGKGKKCGKTLKRASVRV